MDWLEKYVEKLHEAQGMLTNATVISHEIEDGDRYDMDSILDCLINWANRLHARNYAKKKTDEFVAEIRRNL